MRTQTNDLFVLEGDTYTDLYTSFATEELRATPPTVLCSVSLSNTVYTKMGNPAALVFIPICAGRRAGMWIYMNTCYMRLMGNSRYVSRNCSDKHRR